MQQGKKNQTVRIIAASAVFWAASAVLLLGPSRLEYPAPIYITHLSEIVDSLLMALIFYASIGLVLAKRAAWRAAIIILCLAIAWETVESKEDLSLNSIFPLIALLVVIATRQFYPLKSELNGILSALKRTAIFTVSSTVVACGAFLLLAIHEHRPFHFLPVILETLRHIYSLPSDFEPLRHASASHQIGRSLLFILGVTNYLLIALALAKPVIDRFRLTTYDHARVWRLLRRYAKSSEDYFKYWPADKSYFFGKKTDGFVAYGVHQNICIAVANPIGPNPAKLIDEFNNYCIIQGWQQVFVPVDELYRSMYKAKGFRSIKIGDCALIDLKQFTLETSQSKNMRNITNRFTKKNYQVGFMSHPYDFTSLRQVSDAWQSNGRQERSFLMGYFDTTYLNKSRIFTLHDPSNKLIGFVNLQPSYSLTRSSIDLMRMSPDAASNAMDFLLSQLFTVLHQEGWRQIDIGLAPFSGLDTSRASERTLHLLYTHANRLFAFKGLRRFKDKYQPTWEPQYLMYRGASSNLPQIAIALNALMKYK